jgi:hypothetical protein
MIEWRWNMRPLTVRDALAQNLVLALDFSTAGTFSSGENWEGLRDVAIQHGWGI